MATIEVLRHGNNKFMFIDGNLLMWDLPREHEIQKEVADQAFGDVLVAGYGFGIVTKFLLDNSKVTSVVTVEKYGAVIDKMKEFGPLSGDIVIGDFYDLLEEK